jgi:hypothetical protein
MSKAKGKLRVTSDAEEARIAAGIAAHPDNPEWTAQDFRRAKPFAKMFPAPANSTGTRAKTEADENRCLATPDAGGGGALQGRRTRMAEAHGRGAEGGRMTVSLASAFQSN